MLHDRRRIHRQGRCNRRVLKHASKRRENIRPRAHVDSFVRALLARWREKPILADSREREREISIYAIESLYSFLI